MAPSPSVLVVHNRYRVEGGEERAVDLQLAALAGAGVPHRLLERRSTDTSGFRAAAALLRGGEREDEVATAVREAGAGVAHFHNMQPLVGPRGLAAARAAGARVVLHLHNARLFCAIGVASRDGGPCFRCHGRNTLPGLALNCRGSLPEAVAYAAGLAAHQPQVWESVDRFVTVSEWAAGQLALLGVPADRLDVLPHYLPATAFAERSAADAGGYALFAGRLAPEKGADLAVAAAVAAGVPLKVAGDGPAAAEVARQVAAAEAGRAGTSQAGGGAAASPAGGGAAASPAGDGPRVDLLGRVPRERMAELLAGAALLVVPSRCHEFSPFAALEAMAAGVPVVATRMGGLPELIGPERCVPLGDPDALAARMRSLWDDPDARRVEGDELLARARERHSEERYLRDLLAIYA